MCFFVREKSFLYLFNISSIYAFIRNGYLNSSIFIYFSLLNIIPTIDSTLVIENIIDFLYIIKRIEFSDRY